MDGAALDDREHAATMGIRRAGSVKIGRLKWQYPRSRQIPSQAAGTSRKKKAKRLMRNGIEALKRAAGIAAKAERKGTISSGCARSEEHTSELQSPDHLVCR